MGRFLLLPQLRPGVKRFIQAWRGCPFGNDWLREPHAGSLQDLIREGHHAAHPSVELHWYTPLECHAHIFEHLTGVHLDHQDGLSVLGKLADLGKWEGTQGDWAQQPNRNALCRALRTAESAIRPAVPKPTTTISASSR
jgi:hypothetical protein